MSILPYEKFELRTALSQEEILKRMTVNTQYRGHASGDEFNVQRVISYRNSFLPKIKGEIQEDSRGANIQITMKLHTFAIVFMGFWLTFVLAACIFILTLIDTSEPFDIFQYIPFLMLLSGIIMTIVPFKKESAISKKDLLSILEAEVVPIDRYK